MKTITFTCETITPMFLSGADGSTPELRPPSIKGALRFWWRAMNGHLATTGIPNLLKEDERLFGGANEGGKSSVLVRVFDRKEKFIDCPILKSYVGHNPNDRNKPYEKVGLAYLYYVLLNQKCQGLEGFDVETTFKVSLESKSLEDLRKGVASFWLFVHLGGLGSRARRGAGCIQVTDIVDEEDCLLDEEKKPIISFLPDEANGIVSFYTENYKKCIGILQKPNTPEGYSKDNDKYSTLTSSEIYISSDFPSWQKALDNIGFEMKKLRDFFSAENRKFKLKDIPKKAAFGLPIRIRDVRANPQKGIMSFEGYYVDLESSPRRASPLIISIFKQGKKNEEAKYYWVLTYLDGVYTDAENAITIRNSEDKIHSKNGKEFKWQDADHSLVKTFINKLSKTRITL